MAASLHMPARGRALAALLLLLSTLLQPSEAWGIVFRSYSWPVDLSLAVVEKYVVGDWAVRAFSGGTDIPYDAPGPCMALQRLTSNPIDALGGRVTLVVTAPAYCAAVPKPYPAVIIYAGYHVAARYYKSIADRLASYGYVVIQYDRPGATTPSSETETAFFSKILAWAQQANATASHPLFRSIDASRWGVMGHSMGGSLATIVAADNAALVQGLVLMDPVDYTHLSTRIARSYEARFNKPLLLFGIGVHCLDRNGCVKAPLDRRPTRADDQAGLTASCTPDWHCCDWDNTRPGLLPKTLAELTQTTGGAANYWEVAPPGSVRITLKNAGHMNFMDYNNEDNRDATFMLVNCPQTTPSATILKDVLAPTVVWIEFAVRGGLAGGDLMQQVYRDWAAAAGGRLSVDTRPLQPPRRPPAVDAA